MKGTRPVRIANCSGFFGDRISAAREMVDPAILDESPVDVLTGDWLAELTMLILHKQRARDAEAGYAGTFLTQMEQVLGTCIDRGIKVVTNAGGLNPSGCARKVRDLGARLGLDVPPRFVDPDEAGRAGSLVAPMPGAVLRVLVEIGDQVVAGQAMLTMEAMKMEHTVVAPAAGTVAEVLVLPGQQLDGGQPLVRIES